MHKALWITRKNYLCGLVRRVSESYGGDDMDFVRSHCQELIKGFPDESIEVPIRTYEEMAEQLKYK